MSTLLHGWLTFMYDKEVERWMAQAACRNHPREDFFPKMWGNSTQAKQTIARVQALCATCPVASQCLEFAYQTDAEGIWAGTTTIERRRHKVGKR